MRKETNMAGVKSVAKALLMLDIHLTDYSPVIVQHPFTSSGMVEAPTENGLAMLDITQGDENLSAWRGLMAKQIDQAKNAYHIYMMLNKPYALSFLSLAEPHLSQKDFSEILADAWIRSENPNMDKNFVKKSLVDMFKKADQSILMDGEEREMFDSFDDTVTIYRGVTSYNAKNIKALSWTTDYQTAEWFAHRFGEEGTVYEAQISKEHILAFFNGRNESEVIVDPKYLTDITEAQEMGNGMTMNQ
ncbi:MAG: hypothetical protein E7539_06300 [Ruminococcaceae bacterium]|nr:hypothetical protein [Oscillospiraceae bacterium]